MAMDESEGLNVCTRKYQINKKSDIMPQTFNLTFKKRQRRFTSLELIAGFGSAVSFTRKKYGLPNHINFMSSSALAPM